MTNYEVQTLLTNYKSIYDGKYWSTGADDSTLSATNWGAADVSGGIENTYGNAWQCYGFSLFMALVLFDKRLTYGDVHWAINGTSLGDGWYLYRDDYSNITLEPGDIIRGNNDGHSAVIWKNENGNVQVVECWGSVNNDIKWGLWNGGQYSTEMQLKNIATYIIKAPKNTSEVGLNVQFNVNGGECSITSKTVYQGSMYGTLPTPTKNGYPFVGWWEDFDAETYEVLSNTIVTKNTDHTLFAHWGNIYKIINVGTNKCLNIYGDNMTTLTNDINVTLWSDSGSNEQKWIMARLGTQKYLRSVIDTAYGLNVYRAGNPYNCNIRQIIGNEYDASLKILLSDGKYLIKLYNYDLYLTVSSGDDGANVYWAEYNGTNYQKWNFIMLNWL